MSRTTRFTDTVNMYSIQEKMTKKGKFIPPLYESNSHNQYYPAVCYGQKKRVTVIKIAAYVKNESNSPNPYSEQHGHIIDYHCNLSMFFSYVVHMPNEGTLFLSVSFKQAFWKCNIKC